MVEQKIQVLIGWCRIIVIVMRESRGPVETTHVLAAAFVGIHLLRQLIHRTWPQAAICLLQRLLRRSGAGTSPSIQKEGRLR